MSTATNINTALLELFVGLLIGSLVADGSCCWRKGDAIEKKVKVWILDSDHFQMAAMSIIIWCSNYTHPNAVTSGHNHNTPLSASAWLKIIRRPGASGHAL